MKKQILLLLGLVIAIGVSQAQNDKMYFMKGNSVIHTQSITAADLDSVVFYDPTTIAGKNSANIIWSQASLGTDKVWWDPADQAPKVASLPRFSWDYNWVVVGYYDDENYEFALTDMNTDLMDAQDVYVKVIPMTDAWAHTGCMLDSVKGRGDVTEQRFRVVGLYLPPRIGTQEITKINKRAFYPPALNWDGDNQTGAYTDHIRHIFIPKSITEIGDEAFLATNSLMKIEFEQSDNMVTFVEDKNFHSIAFGIGGNGNAWNIPGPNDPQWARTFLGNELCGKYVMPRNYNAVVEEMFRWTNPDTIVVAASVYFIGHRAFLDDDAGGNPTAQGFFDNSSVRVKVIKFLATNPPVLRRGRPTAPTPDQAGADEGSAWHIRPFGTRVKINGTVLADPIVLLVPMSAVDAYKNAASWDGFQNYIKGY